MNGLDLIDTDGKHFYVTNGKRLPSVTTVLQLLANPGLEVWKRSTPDWEAIGNQAAKIGTNVHKMIELHLNKKPVPPDNNVVTKCFNAYLQWETQYEFETIDTEVRVKSEKGYAGTADLVCKVDGVLFIIDFKTSKRIYPDHLLQLAAYRYAYVEKTKRLMTGMAILRLDKHTGTFEFQEYSYEEYKKALQMFLLLVEYWWLREGSDE